MGLIKLKSGCYLAAFLTGGSGRKKVSASCRSLAEFNTTGSITEVLFPWWLMAVDHVCLEKLLWLLWPRSPPISSKLATVAWPLCGLLKPHLCCCSSTTSFRYYPEVCCLQGSCFCSDMWYEMDVKWWNSSVHLEYCLRLCIETELGLFSDDYTTEIPSIK